MLEQKDYCDYKLVLELKELGYDYIRREGLIHLYDAQKWLREEKKIEVVILGEKEVGGPYCADLYTEGGYAGYVHESFEKYESALSEGIKEAIKILKEK